MITSFNKFIGLFLRSDLILPLILIVSYIIFLVIARGVIPTSEELVLAFADLYQKYGYEIIFFAALLESLVLINLFVPGQLAMALGVIFARSGQTDLVTVILVASVGAVCGYLLDFILGTFGFSDIIKRLGYGGLLIQARKQLKRFGKRGLILGFVHSNIGSFISLTAGASNTSWRVFVPIAILATFFWLTIWGIVIYIFGEVILTLISKYGFLLIALSVSGIILSSLWKGKKA